MAVRDSALGVLAPQQNEAREHILELLTKAYWMEIETVMSYLAASVNPDGARAQEVRDELADDVFRRSRGRGARRRRDHPRGCGHRG